MGSLDAYGAANTEKGESRRNENVQVTMIDNNAARELSSRMGLTATVVSEFLADRGYFGSEIGVNPSNPIHAASQGSLGVHGPLFWTHGNSIFNARTFFQVGPVQPAHGNQFGANVEFGLWKGAYFNRSLSENKNRGQVNGNVLIPLPEERTPLTTAGLRILKRGWIRQVGATVLHGDDLFRLPGHGAPSIKRDPGILAGRLEKE